MFQTQYLSKQFFQVWSLHPFHFSYLLFFLEPRHGNWGPWQPADWDSAPSSGGFKYRKRKCDSPCPAYGGRPCSGESISKKDCNECNECNDANGGCEHLCMNTHGSYTCRCLPGYKSPASNWKRCNRKCVNLNYMTALMHRRQEDFIGSRKRMSKELIWGQIMGTPHIRNLLINLLD